MFEELYNEELFKEVESWGIDYLKNAKERNVFPTQKALTASLNMTGGYIIEGDERDGMFYTPEMSRRARVIELWDTLKYLGKAGIDEMIVDMHERVKQFAELLRDIDRFTVLNDVVFNQVIVQCETDEITHQVINAIQEMRECWVGGSTWQGRKAIRISVCSWATPEEDVLCSVTAFIKELNMLKKKDK